MLITNPVYYDDMDIKISIGNLIFNVLYIRYESPRPNWNVENHFHTAYELHYIPEGNGTLWIEKDSYEITPKTFYLTGPNVYHEQKTDKKSPMSEFVLCFEIIEYKKSRHQNKPFDIEELETILSTYNNTGFWIGLDEYNNIELFEKIFWELREKQTGYVFNVKSLCTQIIVNAARCCMSKKESANTVPVKISDDKRRFILDFYFGECYKTLTFNELASKLNVSVRQLNRIIKTFYNTTYKEKLISIKIQNAIHLLQTTNMTAEAIAENVGFSSTTYFFRVFKKQCKMSPMQYKTKHLC